jgi:hypothetical protein
MTDSLNETPTLDDQRPRSSTIEYGRHAPQVVREWMAGGRLPAGSRYTSFSRKDKAADVRTALTPPTVLMDRSPDPPATAPTAGW